MPFDEEDDVQQSMQSQKVGLKNVSSQKSILDSLPKKPTQSDLNQKVKTVTQNLNQNKTKVADLATQFVKVIQDKTLPDNKTIFQKDLEKELIQNMIKAAADINDDPSESQDGLGSLGWITVLLKVCLFQRDRANNLEYDLLQLKKYSDPSNLNNLISKEIAIAIDKLKKSE